ncbi:MAG: long-chain fatty acid--CoA ligase [Chloroflexi bacterium]|nr:long-chain fatty acid--CoA ligase [Chloroflexota bacterium]
MYPQQSIYVTDWLAKRAQLTPHKIGLQEADTGQQVTFAAWNERVNRTANYLRSLGVGKGDRVSTYAENRAEYVDIFLACGKIGAIQHNMNWRLTVNELESMVRDAEPAVLVYSGQYAAQAADLRARVDGSDGSTVYVALDGGSDDRDFSERLSHEPTLADRPALTFDDPWGIYYTGGTTGLPKGAILTHGNITWNSINTITGWDIGPDDVALLQLPLFHVGGPNIFFMPLIHLGGKTILCEKFDVDQTFDLITQAGVTHFVGVPTMFLMMQEHERWAETDFSHMKLIISGGAPCPRAIMEKFWAKGVDFKMGYGLTEAAGNNFWLPVKDIQRKPESVGFPLIHVDMKVVRPDGTTCEPNEAGELLIRGPHVTPGYWNRPEATAETLVDGWLHTGDLASHDDEGYFKIIGRIKDMLISGGENVYPAEIESVMHSHPAVGEAALIAVPHEKWGEVGRAIVVVKPGATLSEEALIAYLGERLARYKIPKSVVFIDEMPKTVIGKLDKKVLVQQYGTTEEHA